MAISGPQHGRTQVELPHPSAAIVVGSAEHPDGVRVGVYGYSEVNKGVYAESRDGIGLLAKGGELAGSFEGGVKITGALTVGNSDLLKVIRQLQEKIDDLQQQVQDLQGAQRTNEGGPLVRGPRPQIGSIEQAPRTGEGFRHFTVRGSGFAPMTEVHLKIQNPRGQAQGTVRRSEGDGSLFAGAISVNCTSGERLTFSATDKRPDPNDVTNELWSLPREHTVT